MHHESGAQKVLCNTDRPVFYSVLELIQGNHPIKVIRILIFILLFAQISDCSEQAPETAMVTKAAMERIEPVDFKASVEQNTLALHQLFEDYFESDLELHPTFAIFVGDNRFNDRYANGISPEWLTAAQTLELAALDRLQAIDDTLLLEEDLLNY
jgi:hypothetical protein